MKFVPKANWARFGIVAIAATASLMGLVADTYKDNMDLQKEISFERERYRVLLSGLSTVVRFGNTDDIAQYTMEQIIEWNSKIHQDTGQPKAGKVLSFTKSIVSEERLQKESAPILMEGNEYAFPEIKKQQSKK